MCVCFDGNHQHQSAPTHSPGALFLAQHAHNQTTSVNREREPRRVRISQPAAAAAVAGAANRRRRRRRLPVKATAAILILTTAMIMMMRIFFFYGEGLFLAPLCCHQCFTYNKFHKSADSRTSRQTRYPSILLRDIVDRDYFFPNRTLLFFTISQASSFSSLFHTNTLSNTNFSWTLFTLWKIALELFDDGNHFSAYSKPKKDHQTNVFSISSTDPSGSDCVV